MRHELAKGSATKHAYSQLSDEELMLLYQKDDEAAFHAIYRRYSAKVYGYLSRKLQDPHHAADVCQNVFIKLHGSRAVYQASLPFTPWLFTIAKNALVDWQRSGSSRFEGRHQAMGKHWQGPLLEQFFCAPEIVVCQKKTAVD